MNILIYVFKKYSVTLMLLSTLSASEMNGTTGESPNYEQSNALISSSSASNLGTLTPPADTSSSLSMRLSNSLLELKFDVLRHIFEYANNLNFERSLLIHKPENGRNFVLELYRTRTHVTFDRISLIEDFEKSCLSALWSLNLNNIQYNTPPRAIDQVVKGIIDFCTAHNHITSFSIDACENAGEFIAILNNIFPDLEQLAIKGKMIPSLDMHGAQTFESNILHAHINKLGNLNKLKSLTISNVHKLTPQEIFDPNIIKFIDSESNPQYLFLFLKSLKNLEHLEINSTIYYRALCQLNFLYHLKSLKIGPLIFIDNIFSYDEYFSFLKNNPIESFCIKLGCDGNDIDNKCFKSIVNAVSINKTVKKLSLTHDFTETYSFDVLKQLCTNTQLTDLQIHRAMLCCSDDAQDSSDIYKIISSELGKLVNLRYLSIVGKISCMDAETSHLDFLRYNTALQELDLSGLQITKGALEILAGCSNLTTLTINFNSEYTADDTFYIDPTTSADIVSVLSGPASTLRRNLGLTILTDAPDLFNLDTLKERFPFIKLLRFAGSDEDA